MIKKADTAMSDLSTITILNIGLYMFAAAVTLCLLIGCVTDRNRNRPFMKHFIRLLVAHIFMLLGETGLCLFEGSPETVTIAKFCCLLSYGCSYLVAVCTAYCLVGFIQERAELSSTVTRSKISSAIAHAVAGICAVYTLLVMISLWNGMLFYFDDACMLVYTDSYIIVNLGNFFILLVEMALVIQNRKVLTTQGMLSLLSFSVLPLISLPLDFLWDTAPIYMATTLSLIVVYTLFHGELSRQLAEKERQLTESRIATTISQIQPHFLYNVLNSIYYLCGEEPKTAQAAVSKFSDYLRNNLNSLTQRTLIPFSKEFDHIQTYLELEKIRFGDDLTIVYDIQADSFFLPVLSVQPLVENAVKHGVTKKRGGGIVTLATREEAERYVITITDTGVGFDPEHYMDDGKNHVGIQNARLRLERLVGGTLEVASTPGSGAAAVVTIPKKEDVSA